MINKIDQKIIILGEKKEFLKQQTELFRINGFENFANIFEKEIRFIEEDIADLEYEKKLIKKIEKKRLLKKENLI